MKHKLMPSLPLSVQDIVDGIVKTTAEDRYKYLNTDKQIKILSAIAANPACFAYTAEFGCLSDLVADIFSSLHKPENAHALLVECFEECWTDQIDHCFAEAHYNHLVDDVYACDMFVYDYADKHGV